MFTAVYVTFARAIGKKSGRQKISFLCAEFRRYDDYVNTLAGFFKILYDGIVNA